MSEITLQEYQKLVQQQGQALLAVIGSVAQGDLDVQVEVPEGVEILSELAVGLERMIDGLRETLAEQKQTQQKLQAALAEVLDIQRRYLRQEWTEYTQAADEARSYVWSGELQGPAADIWLPAMTEAVQRAETTVQAAGDGATLAVPIKIYDQVIGVIGFDRPDGQPWSRQDIATVESIVEQVGWALESQRLFDQEQRAYRQLSLRVNEMACLNDIGRKMDESPPVAEFLAWVAERIPAAMQFPSLCRVAIELEGQVYGAPEAAALPRHIVQGLSVGGQQVGRIVIAYTQDRDFLDEESALLGDIVRRVSGYLENRRLLEETRTALQETQTLFRIARGLAQAQSQQEMFELVLVEYLEALGLPQGGVMTLDPNRQYGTLHALVQHGRLVKAGMRIPIADNPPTQRALETKKPVIIRDALHDELTAPVRDLVSQLGYRSLLLVPIIVRGEAIGLLGADSVDEIHDFSEREVALVRAVADQLGIAMEHQRLLQETRAALAETEALYRAGERLALAADVDETAQIVVEEIGRRGIPLLRFILTSPWDSPTPQAFEVVAAWNTQEKTSRVNPPGTRLPDPVVPFFTKLLHSQAPRWYTIQEKETLPPVIRGFLQAADMQAVTFAPVFSARHRLGLIALAKPDMQPLEDRLLDYIQALITQVAITIENRYLLEEAQARAHREQVLRETVAAVSASEDLVAGLPLITQHLRQLIPIEALSLTVYTPGATEYTLFAVGAETEVGHFASQGLRLPVEGTAPGWVIAHNEAWLDTDFRETQPFMEDGQLVEEGLASRLILPLRVGEQVVGTLNLGSSQVGAYTEDDLLLLSQVADQMALALERARLLEETRIALAEVEAAHRAYLRKSWREHLRQREMLNRSGFLYDRLQDERPARPIAAPDLWRPEMEKAVLAGAAATVLDEGEEVRTGLAIPIRVRGQTIGVLGVESPGGERRWTEDDLALLEAVSDQLGQTLEGARLFADAQRRAERERLIGEISARIRASTDMHDIAETAATELGQALGTARALVRVGLTGLQRPQVQDRSPEVGRLPPGEEAAGGPNGSEREA